MAMSLQEKYYTMQNLLAQAQGLQIKLQLQMIDFGDGVENTQFELQSVLYKLNRIGNKKASGESNV